VALLDQGAGSNRVDLGRLVVTPELAVILTEVIAGGITGRVVGHRRGELVVETGGLCAALDLIAPIGVDLTGKINGETHWWRLLFRMVAEPDRSLNHHHSQSANFRSAPPSLARFHHMPRRSRLVSEAVRLSRPLRCSGAPG